MELEFLDLGSKAKELGISEAAMRARILSGKERCFGYVANVRASASNEEWLPPWTEEAFPFIEWLDHGSAFRGSADFDPRGGWPANRAPSYHLAGWVLLNRMMVDIILTRGESQLDNAQVHVCDGQSEVVCSLHVFVEPKKEWVTAKEVYDDGGYWREIPITLTAADLFIPSASPDAKKSITSRKEQSYLSIIAAMRALLRHKDGGGFPSEAKIIEQLVSRFGTANGVSKRNLETVFADATRTTDP